MVNDKPNSAPTIYESVPNTNGDGVYPARSSGKPIFVRLDVVFLTESGVGLAQNQKHRDVVRSILIPDPLSFVVPTFEFEPDKPLYQLEEAVYNPEHVCAYYTLGYVNVHNRSDELKARKFLLDSFPKVIEKVRDTLQVEEGSIPVDSVIPLVRRFAAPSVRFPLGFLQ